MSTAQPKATPYDTGNTLLEETPAQMTAVWLSTRAGYRLAVTIRTSSATVTAMLSGPDIGNWAALLREASRKDMTTGGIVVAGRG